MHEAEERAAEAKNVADQLQDEAKNARSELADATELGEAEVAHLKAQLQDARAEAAASRAEATSNIDELEAAREKLSRRAAGGGLEMVLVELEGQLDNKTSELESLRADTEQQQSAHDFERRER